MVWLGAEATAEVCMTSGGLASDLLLIATRTMIARMTKKMTAPPEPRSGIFIESRESLIEGGVSSSDGSIVILLLMNFVSFTLSFSSSQCCSTISIL